MTPLDFLSAPLAERIALTLLHFLWQGVLIAAIVALVIHMLRLSRGNARYIAYLIGMLAMLAAPVVTFFVLAPSTPRALAPHSPAILSPAPIDIAPIAVETAVAAQPLSWRERTLAQLDSSVPWIVPIWIAGVMIFAIRLLIAAVYAQWCRHRAGAIAPALLERFTAIATRMHMRPFRRIFTCDRVTQPLVTGLLRPVVLLPASLISRTPVEMLEAIVAHELAHVRRWDLWVNCAQRIIEMLLFYHPAVWWMSRRLREEREICCDELAVSVTGGRMEYATMLQQVAARIVQPDHAAMAASLSPRRNLLARVRHVLRESAAQRPSAWPVAVALGSVAILIALSMMLTASPPAMANAPDAGESAEQLDEAIAAPADVHEHRQEQILRLSRALSQQRQRLRFQLNELRTELRDRTIKLRLDGLGTQELVAAELIRQRMDLEQKLSEAKSELARLERNEDHLDRSILQKIESDPRLGELVRQLDELDLKHVAGEAPNVVETQRSLLKRKIEQRRAELTASLRAARLRELKAFIEGGQVRLAQLADEIRVVNRELGDLSYAANLLQTRRDEERRLSEQLNRVQDNLDRLLMLEMIADDLTDQDWEQIRRDILGLLTSRER